MFDLTRYSSPVVVRSWGSLLAAALMIFVACTPSSPPPAAETPEAMATGAEKGGPIPWFEGAVEEAFALAKQERKPVFLYWGAVWCPPCHVLRTKLFTRPDFQARLAATVPVYLDGDTERAQIWGEKLHTLGYPTVIIFDADGNEVTRIESALPYEEYAAALTRALEVDRPFAELLAAARDGGAAALTPAELGLLASHAWGQDETSGLDRAARQALFARLREETPAAQRDVKARFLALELEALSEAGKGAAGAKLSAKQRAALLAALDELLADPALRRANLDLLLYRAPGVIALLTPEAGAERTALAGRWEAAARAVEEDASLPTTDRLSALWPQLALAAPDGEDAAVPAALQERVRERIRWASGLEHGEEETQALLNTMAGLLERAGLAGEAKELLTAHLAEALAPYYYTSWLAGLEAREGNPAAAVALYRQAWQGARERSSGAAMTPFRWGSSYLQQLMKLTPEAQTELAADARIVLGDLLASPDAFSHGNWARLQSLAGALTEWQGSDPGRTGVVDAIRAQVAARCGELPATGDDSAAARCRGLFASAAS